MFKTKTCWTERNPPQHRKPSCQNSLTKYWDNTSHPARECEMCYLNIWWDGTEAPHRRILLAFRLRGKGVDEGPRILGQGESTEISGLWIPMCSKEGFEPFEPKPATRLAMRWVYRIAGHSVEESIWVVSEKGCPLSFLCDKAIINHPWLHWKNVFGILIKCEQQEKRNK